MEKCIFCKIINEKLPSAKIYESETIIAFLDINPANKGHVLVIPKAHYKTMEDISPDVLSDLIQATQMVTKVIVKATSCHGYNVIMNNNKAAGQLVEHAHFHVIPRLQGDNTIPPIPRQRYGQREIREYTKALKTEIKDFIKRNKASKKSATKRKDPKKDVTGNPNRKGYA